MVVGSWKVGELFVLKKNLKKKVREIQNAGVKEACSWCGEWEEIKETQIVSLCCLLCVTNSLIFYSETTGNPGHTRTKITWQHVWASYERRWRWASQLFLKQFIVLRSKARRIIEKSNSITWLPLDRLMSQSQVLYFFAIPSISAPPKMDSLLSWNNLACPWLKSPARFHEDSQ